MGRLQLEEVTKRYDEVVAVEEMELDIADGEFVSLVGPSGCGKSTTLEIIGGLTSPTEGRVRIDGADVTGLPPKDRNIAMVFQNIALFPHMDVYDNVSYGLRVRGEDKEKTDRRVEEAMEILQLDGMLDRMPAELSGGQRQRVAIGRAIVRDPDVFLMDEPLANLDAKLRVHMRTELQRIQRELDVTTVYVTHDQEEAMTMSDRIAIINDGELQQIAPPIECYDRPANLFVAGFIGSPSMNFFQGEFGDSRLEAVDVSVPIDSGMATKLSNGQTVTLGVRPEDIYAAGDSESADSPTEPMRVVADVIEPVGNETFVYLVPGDREDGPDRGAIGVEAGFEGDDESEGRVDQLLMRTEAHSKVNEGEELDIVFDRANVHLFDTASGDAIAHGIGGPAEQPVGD